MNCENEIYYAIRIGRRDDPNCYWCNEVFFTRIAARAKCKEMQSVPGQDWRNFVVKRVRIVEARRVDER
jgi:hypothetical protein